MRNFFVLLFLYVSVHCVLSAPNPVVKRTHNHGPMWMDECWDHGHGHFVNPWCDLFTSPTTTTSTLAPTTTPRTCNYQVYNDSNIKDTDYISTVQGAESGAVHVTQNLTNCQGLCERSLLQNSFECWAFTYNYQNSSIGCYLYYYPRPLHHVPGGEKHNGTTLYLKRCSDDPFGNLTYSTVSPRTTTKSQTTQAVSGSVSTTAASISTGSSSGTTSGNVPVVDTNSFRIQGVTQQQAPDSCHFLGGAFSLGDTWKDTCRYNCQCTNTTTNIATCIDICPLYTNVTRNCQVVKQPGSCCGILDCSGVASTFPPRTCTYDAHNQSAISDTDFGPGLPMREDTNITLNEPVFLAVDQTSCEMMCSQSLVHVRFECRAYTFSSSKNCHLYHYFRPLNYMTSSQNQTRTTLYLKRCSDDPVTVPPTGTVSP